MAFVSRVSPVTPDWSGKNMLKRVDNLKAYTFVIVHTCDVTEGKGGNWTRQKSDLTTSSKDRKQWSGVSRGIFYII